MIIRARTDDDLDACIRIAEAVQKLDGYPIHLPASYEVFVASPGALDAWVATGDDGEILGHVALHPHSTPESIGLACEYLRVAPSSLGVIARLFVAPEARRAGVARALLDTATAAARARGLLPVLDVAVTLLGAIALYEQSGWQRIGRVTVHFSNGEALDELVFIPEAS